MGASTAADPLEVVSAVPHAGTLGSYSTCVRCMRAWACSAYSSPHAVSAETIGCDARTGTRLTMAGPSFSGKGAVRATSFAYQAPREKVAEKKVPLTGFQKSPPRAANQNSDNKQR